jgi:hypothetical protein
MDPDEALKKAREALKRMGDEAYDAGDMAQELAEAFEALDGWLSKGGFPPHAWDRGLAPENDAAENEES